MSKGNPSTPDLPKPGKPAPRQALGRWGEALAAQYFECRGYQILERNVRTPHGELDLIAMLPPGPARPDPADPGACREMPTIVFIEVKTRSSRAFGYPEESVNPRKQAHLISAAQYYMQQHPEMECHWRIDVVAIQRTGKGQPPQIVHFENALGE